MIIKNTKLNDCYYFDLKKFLDNRGFFFEISHQSKYKNYIKKKIVQTNFSHSKKNVFRGMHFQVKNPQGKLLTVLSGKIKDIIIDLRKQSSTYGKVDVVNLSEKKNQQIWIPEGFGHGFISLTDKVKIIYQCTDFYYPKYEKTLSYKDPKFKNIIKNIKFKVSNKDLTGLSFNEVEKII
ncbi:dTDP-4-dehydrorhamnose 3,5-epimerase [Candidatus Pelagibacter ubique]|nr:dTDP-4-dehydrorhamnose 3,5-epimerase [Candidatus Pelagibacter ubique]